ncbi:glycosyltransferase family 2 protein [Methylobacterium radiotolerans]|uniref:glycosyltransferase family 2 protein n=1 Tax=Methylobacterium radiotolerans TaxID=31998 RepID=UPI000D5E51DE|nr:MULTISPECIES: glycosyltransferase family 2 protein [Methylobacterium]MDE3749367.1 glycosyltransferase family 2 protein [Methylobacterium radiotolerans]PVY93950.1 glycosyl transferase family 2 [Methylobacterium organophilum]
MSRAPAGAASAPAPGPNGPLPLSVFIIAHNEVDRIGATIRAVRGLTDDLVVIDSGSTDGTQALAASLGARVLHNPWPGYGPQKRFAEEQCRHVWLLNLDADEVVPPELVREIRGLWAAGEPRRPAWRIGIAEIFPGEGRPHPLAYTLTPVRLYRKDRGRYAASPVHDRVALEPGVSPGRLRGVIHHFSVRSLGDQLDKLNRYSDQQADDLEARGVVIPTWRVFVELPGNFLKAYLGRRHFVRGTYGFLTAMNYAISRHLRVAKHVERRRVAAARQDRVDPPDPTF